MPDKVSAHEPGAVTVNTFNYTSQAEDDPISNYTMQLFDTSGQQMPNVFVNEHFTCFTPPGFTINGDGDYWTTGDLGVFKDFDRFSWAFGTLAYPYNLFQDYNFFHTYCGGTQSANGPWNNPPNPLYGFNGGSYEIEFLYDSPAGYSTAKQQ